MRGASGGAEANAALERAGFDGEAIARLLDELRSDVRSDLHSVLIFRGGRLASETYFNGADSDALHDVRSAGKSITSALMGIALDRGLVGSVDDEVGRYFPEHAAGLAGIRVRDLLTMRSGLAADDADPSSPGNEDALDRARDPLALALSLPQANPPGSAYVYASSNALLAGALIENAARTRLDEFAHQYLFTPLGIERFHWARSAGDRVKGQGNLSLRARDFLRIGELFLDRGRVGAQAVVSSAWVEASFAPHAAIANVDPYADSYGYMWYTKTHTLAGRALPVHFASGNGGNKIYIAPSLGLVLTVMSSAYGRPYGQRRSQDILLRVLASVRA